MRGEEKKSFDFKKFVISAAIGGAVGVLIALLLLLGAAALILGGVIGEGTATVYVSAAVGALVGGLITAKRSNLGALPCAGSAALVMLVIFFLVGLMFFESFAFTSGALTVVLVILIGAIVGAFLGTAKKTKRAKRKSK